jgi:excisionase family DNA binding protein
LLRDVKRVYIVLYDTDCAKEVFRMIQRVEKLLLRPREVAEATGLGRSTTYSLIRSGVIPSITIGSGRIVRVPADALKKWIEERLQATSSGENA